MRMNLITIDKINKKLDDCCFKVEDSISGVTVYGKYNGEGFCVCLLDHVSETIEALEKIRDAVEDVTGVNV